MNDNDVKTVTAMWDALDQRDWDALPPFFGPESIYYDVPLGPGAAARGPGSIVARLRLGIEPLAAYAHHHGVASTGDGGLVMLEHSETWTWSDSESLTLPIATVHRVTDGAITLWRDYWDYGTLMNAAPAWWVEQITTGDMSWLHDATNDV
jgi:limonene-1,2-epoxide hydrolase